MTKTRNTKSALMSSVVALFLCFSMLLGTTYAWFTDSVTSGGNVIQAGTLDVELYQWTAVDASTEITDSSDPIFGAGTSANDTTAATLWEPGKTQTVYLSIKNAGSLDLKYMVALEVYDVDKDIIKVLEYAITPDAKYGDVDGWEGNGVKVNKGTNIAKVGTVDSKDVVLESGEEHFFALSVHMLEEAGNEYQDASVKFDIKVLATQLDSEEDSFGNGYDEDATYPNVSKSEKVEIDTNNTVKNTITLNTVASDENKTEVTIPAGTKLGADVKSVSFQYDREPEVDTAAKTVTFDTFEIVDQNGKVIDLEALGNTKEITVTLNLPIGHGFNAGDKVAVYHDGEMVAEAIVGSDDTITYTTTHFCEITVTKFDGYVVKDAETLKKALTEAAAAGAGDNSILIIKDIDLTDAWTPISVDGYHGAGVVTVEGNGATITGLSAPLFAGGFAGKSGIVIKNLTIADSAIVSTSGLGGGAFIDSADSMHLLTLENCHLKNSTVTGERTGGLIGWCTGYAKLNDGPVKAYVTITNCSVVDSTVTGAGSAGAIAGHPGASDYTYTTIENCVVKNVDVISNDTDDWRTGAIVGTANNGHVVINNVTVEDVTLTQNGVKATETVLFGRFVPSGTGTLEIDGVHYIASSEALQAAINSGVSNIVLMKGEYTADLYNIDKRDSLTITGQGADTKIKFAKLQVRASQFNQLTIDNCTIERMPDKSWGHLVFGSSTTAGGVYTISNCIFNGVSSQGIYINQNVEATFNIENCTFNGDFGGEGAITIQNNDGVNITVDVTDCAFNDIPSTSHEIFVLYAYDGWTLNAEGVNAYWKANN